MDAAVDVRAASAAATWTVTVTKTDDATETAGLEALDDDALVAASVDGRPGAFDCLVVRHERGVYRLCYRFAGNHEDAADLAQDAFLRAYRALGRFKRESSFGTWLYRIAVNVCLTWASRKTPPVEPLDESSARLPVGGSDAVGRLLASERAARVRAAIAKLPAKQRAALLLRVYHEMPHEQIASVLGSSVGAVKANFFHALRGLRRLLGGEPL